MKRESCSSLEMQLNFKGALAGEDFGGFAGGAVRLTMVLQQDRFIVRHREKL